ncbi:MAG: FixH family protein [Hyphomicrobiaceae bacterium]
MLRRPMTVLTLTIGLLAIGSAQATERPKVDVDCKPTEQKLVYACTFSVKGRKSGKAIDAADFNVSADMPSMPMAHNVRPIVPERAKAPGTYNGKLHLEMAGEWALKMTFKKPVRDIVIKKMTFGGAKMDHSKMDHSKHGKASAGETHKHDAKSKKHK